MSDHLKPQSSELVAALHNHGLKSDQPSQLSDAFRLGWNAARSLPAVTADALGAEWMRREAKNRVRDLIYWEGDDGTTLVALRDAAAALDAIPGPTEAQLDAAALARPKVRALVEALKAVQIAPRLSASLDYQIDAALAALPKGVE